MDFKLREMRGLAIVAAGGQIRRIDDDLFLVRSQSSDTCYEVKWADQRWFCNCLDFAERQQACKHVHAVNFLLQLPKIILANTEAIERICPYCGSNQFVLKGHRYNKSGSIQLYLCKICNRRFKEGTFTGNMGNNAAIGTIALDLYFKKLSIRDIRNHIWQIYGIDKPVSTIHSWIMKFTRLIKDVAGNLTPEVGDRWLADEMVIKVNGKKMYLWNIMDYETRYQIVSILMDGRGAREAKIAIEEAINKARKQPNELITDGLTSYSTAVQSIGGKIKHVSNVGLMDHQNNNRIERLHGTIRSWEKTKRGMKNNASELLEVYCTYYNNIKPHMSLLGGSPSNVGNRRWTSLIKNTSIHSTKDVTLPAMTADTVATTSACTMEIRRCK